MDQDEAKLVSITQPGVVMLALRVASDVHAHQRRKPDFPYINHPIRVMQLLTAVGVSDTDTLAIAALHDVVEDCGDDHRPRVKLLLEETFSPAIFNAVMDLSLPPGIISPDDKLQIQLERMETMDIRGVLVKMADKTDNVDDLRLRPPNWKASSSLAYIESARRVVETGLKIFGHLQQVRRMHTKFMTAHALTHSYYRE